MPAVTNGLARGMVALDSALYGTRARGVVLGEADLVLVVGVPLDFRLGFGRSPVISEEARIVYVDCDPRRRHRPGEVALDGDIKQALAALAAAAGDTPKHPGWLEKDRKSTRLN